MQRTTARTAIVLDVRLARKVGRPLTARTLDLSVGGARVVSERPLRIDEELTFDVGLPPADARVDGTARVLRQDGHNVYALRFEHTAPATCLALEAFVRAAAALPLP